MTADPSGRTALTFIVTDVFIVNKDLGGGARWPGGGDFTTGGAARGTGGERLKSSWVDEVEEARDELVAGAEGGNAGYQGQNGGAASLREMWW